MTMRTRARAYLNTTVHIHESSDINNCTCTRVKNRAILVAKLEQVQTRVRRTILSRFTRIARATAKGRLSNTHDKSDTPQHSARACAAAGI